MSLLRTGNLRGVSVGMPRSVATIMSRGWRRSVSVRGAACTVAVSHVVRPRRFSHFTTSTNTIANTTTMSTATESATVAPAPAEAAPAAAPAPAAATATTSATALPAKPEFLVETPLNEIAPLVDALRKTFESDRTRDIKWRKQQLKQLQRMMTEQRAALVEALHRDHVRSEFVSDLMELSGIEGELSIALANIDTWTKPDSVSVPLVQVPASAYHVAEPLGVVLIIAPWNYPIRLLLMPLVGAIAAGNCAVIKPSEISVHCSNALARIVPQYLDPDFVRVVTGGVSQATELLKQRYDHIMYTGSGHVGRIVLRAAAEHLTPVTLELGGKSPVIVDRSANLSLVAKRVLWGKIINSGQTCISPDYLLVERAVVEPLIEQFKKAFADFFPGNDCKSSTDYSRIINDAHFRRLQGYLAGQNIVFGGKSSAEERFMEPTLVLDPSPDCALMKEEIFGPILPIVGVDSVDAAIAYVRARDKPLALYVFSQTRANIDRVLSLTSSGGACVNETVMHAGVPGLHFGGVGPSGMGAYNGHFTFATFSHMRPVLDKATWIDPYIRYPPYTSSKQSWLSRLM